MNLELIKKLSAKPALYEKGTAVMWTDPYISQRLLEMHLNPDHDMASRSSEKIDIVIRRVLDIAGRTGMKILDLGCGPGLYTEKLVERGHRVTGIDFSQHSIQYANRSAGEKKLDIQYIQGNYLEIDIGNSYDLVILIYLDFCVMIPEERDLLLKKIYHALKPGGLFIFDVVNERNLKRKIPLPSWDVQERGFWKNEPYIALNHGYHYPEARVWANHHIIIGEDDTVNSYIFWNHYYGKKDLISILEKTGFVNIENHEKVLPETEDYWNGENVTFYAARAR